MKNTILLVLLLVATTAAFAQTADEVINKMVTASGGREKLNAIKTLQYVQTITLKTPMGDMKLPMQFYREKNKLFRMDATMALGPQTLNFYTVVTDTSGYTMTPQLPMLGNAGGIIKMTGDERKAQEPQMDPAGMFAALTNYSARGSKATLLGSEKVDSADCYKLMLINGGTDTVTYYIDKATNLVARADTKGGAAMNMGGLGSMMGGMQAQADKTEVSTIYADYTDIGGIKFPLKIVLKNQMGDAESVISDIKVNEPVAAKWYKAQ